MQVFDEIVLPAAEEARADLPQAAGLVLDRDTPLLGGESVFDSMALVAIVLAAEDRIEDLTGTRLSLVDASAMSARRSPFRTLGTLAEHIDALLAPPNRS